MTSTSRIFISFTHFVPRSHNPPSLQRPVYSFNFIFTLLIVSAGSETSYCSKNLFFMRRRFMFLLFLLLLRLFDQFPWVLLILPLSTIIYSLKIISIKKRYQFLVFLDDLKFCSKIEI